MKASRRIGRATLLAVAFVTIAAGEAAAQLATWSGGNGTWSTGGNWAGTAPASDSSRGFVFQTATGTATNDLTNVTGTSITFASGTYTLSGSAMNLSGTINVLSTTGTQTIGLGLVTTNTNLRAISGTAGSTLRIDGAISGPGGITFTRFGGSGNAGVLILSASNSHSGGTTLNATSGTLGLANDFALGSGTFTVTAGNFDAISGPLTIANQMYYNNTTGTFLGSGGLSITGTTTVQGASRLVVAASTLTLKSLAAVASSESLEKRGSGMLTITDAAQSSFKNFLLTAGTVRLGTGQAVGTGTLAFANGSSGEVQGLAGLTEANAITANVSLVGNAAFSGSNSITLTGTVTNNSTSGRTITNNLDVGRTLTFDGPLSIVEAAGSGTTRALTLAGTGAMVFNGPISNGGVSSVGNVALTNTTTQVTLAGNNTYTGTTTFRGGLLTISGSNTGGLIDFTTARTGTVTLTGMNTGVGGLQTSYNGAGLVRVGNSAALGTTGTLTLGDADYTVEAMAPATFSNPVRFAETAVSGSSITLQGPFVRTSALGNGVLVNNMGAGGLLTLSGTVFLMEAGVASSGGMTLSGNGSTLISGNILNGGTGNTNALTKYGTGTLTLSGSNSFGGGLRLGDGVSGSAGGGLTINNPWALGSGTVTISDIVANAPPVLGNTSGSAVATQTANFFSVGNTPAVAFQAENDLDISGGGFSFSGDKFAFDVRSGAGALTVGVLVPSGGLASRTWIKRGDGTLILNGSSQFVGAVQVAAGRLRLSGTGDTGPGGVTVFSGTYDVNGLNRTFSSLTLGGSAAGTQSAVTTATGTLTLGGDVTYTGTAANDGGATISGNLNLGTATRTFAVADSTGAANDVVVGANVTGTVGLTKTLAGVLLLGGTNTYTGTTTISAGMLEIESGSALPGIGVSGRIITAAGAILAMGNGVTDADIATLSTTGSFASGGLAGGMLGFDTSAGSRSSAAVIGNPAGGSLALVKIGDNTLTLSGSSTFSSAASIRQGAVEVAWLPDSGQASPLGTAATFDLGAAATSGTLRYVGSGDVTNRGGRLADGGGVIDAVGAGAIQFSGGFSGTGAGLRTLLLAGTSTAGNALTGAITDGSGTTAVRKTDAGTWTLSNSGNSFSGQLHVAQGTLFAANTGALGSATALVGGTDAGLGGSANLFVVGTGTLNRQLQILAAGGGATQAVVLGGTNTSGTAAFGSVIIRVGRDVTLQAATGGAVRFVSNWIGASGSGSLPASSITFGGAGSAGTVIVSSSIALTSGSMRVAAGTLSLANQIIRPASGQPLYLAPTTQLVGSGTMAGTITGEGLVAPGNSPGILVADAVDGSGGLDWAYEFTSLGSPNYGQTGSGALNDVLRLTGSSPFSGFALTTSSTVSVYFTMSSLGVGDVIRGGFFTDSQSDFLSSISGATYNYYVMGSGSGTDTTYNGQGYYSLSNYNSNLLVNLATVAETGTFSGSSGVPGQVMQFSIANATVGTTYTLSATASPAAIRVGQSTGITATVTNTGTGLADSLTVGSLGVTVSPSGMTAIGFSGGTTAASGGGLVTGTGAFTTNTPGSYTVTPFASATNTTLGTPATATGTAAGSLAVYSPASATVNTATPVTLGRVIVGGAFGTQAVSITNSGTAADPYQESLDATVSGSSGGASWSGSVTNLFTTSTGISVGLGGASTATAGVRSGTVTLAFVSTGTSSAGWTGLSPQALGTQDLAVSGTVLAHSMPSLDPVSQLVEQTLSLGTWDYELGQWIVQTGTSAFSFWNVASEAPATLTAGLEVTGTSYTGSNRFTTTFSPGSSSLIAAGTSATYAALFNTAGLVTSGTYTGTFTFLTADQNLPGATAGSPLAVRVNVIVVPEPETAVFAGIGIAMLGWTMWKRRRLATITRDR